MKNLMQWVLAATLICGTSGFASCGNDDDAAIVTPAAKEYFTQWNQCEALTALQNYVKDVTDVNSPNYIQEEDRIATFDMDGTFVGELYPSYFEYNLLEYRALDDPDYEAPKDVMETTQQIANLMMQRQQDAASYQVGEMKAARLNAEACMDGLIQYVNALLVASPDAALEETAQYIQQDFNKVEAQYQQSRKHGKKEDPQPDGGKDDGEGGDVTPVTPEA